MNLQPVLARQTQPNLPICQVYKKPFPLLILLLFWLYMAASSQESDCFP